MPSLDGKCQVRTCRRTHPSTRALWIVEPARSRARHRAAGVDRPGDGDAAPEGRVLLRLDLVAGLQGAPVGHDDAPDLLGAEAAVRRAAARPRPATPCSPGPLPAAVAAARAAAVAAAAEAAAPAPAGAAGARCRSRRRCPGPSPVFSVPEPNITPAPVPPPPAPAPCSPVPGPLPRTTLFELRPPSASATVCDLARASS